MLEVLVGLDVTNEGSYREYRNSMKPILSSMGGGFRYDFHVSQVDEMDISETFISEIDYSINRLFIIYFPDSTVRDKFFSNENYLDIKLKFFTPAVEKTTIIAEWES